MLSENIRNLRKNKGMSQEELAAKLNVVRQTVSKWEQNLSVPDSEMLVRIAEIFEVPVSGLLGETVGQNDSKSELAEISQKLENLNSFLADKYARRRKIFLTFIAVCMIIIAIILFVFAFVVVRRTSFVADNSEIIIGGANVPTEIMIASAYSWVDSVVAAILSLILTVSAVFIIKRSR